MKVEKNKIYYYITSRVIIKLKASRTDEGYTSILFEILDYIKGNEEEAGMGELGVGNKISSNQLNFVATEGADKLIHEEGKKSIVAVFSGEIL